MSTRMLIDARHPEETRVTVVKGSRVEEFDYESATKRPLKGNIYLARVTRVEPSLQAAFVEYGGNRHGFLAFSEIHPDYYQIPVEDRRELIEAETKAALERSQEIDAKIEQEAEEAEKKKKSRRGRRSKKSEDQGEDASESKTENAKDSDVAAINDGDTKSEGPASPDDKPDAANSDDTISEFAESAGEEESAAEKDAAASTSIADNATVANDEDDNVAKDSDEAETDEEIAEAAARRHALRALKRRYSIQEVIKRRQVLLVQVVKEERGNKGAALTTYMSLAGRYCVLMPNSTHSGGISRKISNASDRRSLKKIISSLEVPDEMGLIVRTAGMERTKTEIKRDFDYLVRLWSGIRDLTLKSVAPSLVYEEGNLIKRTIRDLYTRDIDEIQVEGEEGYKSAKEFMKMLMPSHAKKVQHYTDPIPLFHRYQVENHLEAMYQPVVQLRSGGYIVINPTEALISIDVNSGRATKEHNIEETAVKTNLEAAEEVARQLRLRDLAGLVVIDFIDMEERSNNRSVERRMKDVLKSDRARIQVGRISSFGLMEMSRQRLRSNLQEMSMETCTTCAGTGIVRSVESAALMALRQLEEEGIRGRSSIVRVAVCPEVAVYLLNKKRSILTGYENKYGIEIEILAQPSMGPSDLELTYEAGSGTPTQADNVVKPDTQATDLPAQAPATETRTPSNDGDDKPQRTRRRRRRRRRGGDDNQETTTSETGADSKATNDNNDANNGGHASAADSDGQERRPRRRRGSRGGRRRPDRNRDTTEQAAQTVDNGATDATKEQSGQPPQNDDGEEKPRTRRRRVRKSDDSSAPETAAADAPTDTATEQAADKDTAKPRRGRRKKVETTEATSDSPETVTVAASDDEKKPRRRSRKSAKDADVKAENAETGDTVAKKPRSRRKKSDDTPAVDSATESTAREQPAEKPAKKPARGRPRKTAVDKAETDKGGPSAAKAAAAPTPAEKPTSKSASTPPAENTGGGDDQPKRKGWWQRNFG